MSQTFFDANDPGFREIVDLFVSELPDRALQIEQALAGNDRDTLRRAGHQLKGAAGCYGFNDLTNPAAALQSACDEAAENEALRGAAERLVQACREAVRSHEAAGVVG